MLTTSIEITVIKPIRNEKDWEIAQRRLDYLLIPEVKAYEKPEGNPLREILFQT